MKKIVAYLLMLLFAAFATYVVGIVFYAVILFPSWLEYGWQWEPLLRACTWIAAAVVLGIVLMYGFAWASKVLSSEFDMIKKRP